MRAADAAFAAVRDFYLTSRYGKRRGDPGICDFTFGNPHEMPLDGIVTALRAAAVPHDKNWFAYKTSEEEPQAFLAEHGAELVHDAPQVFARHALEGAKAHVVE